MYRGKKVIVYAVSGLALALSLYAIVIEPNHLEVTHIELKDTALNHMLKGRIAVHLSDLHISRMGKREKEILRTLDALKPDLIFLTGDYVQWKENYEEALWFLAQLDAPLGVWAVMGDYDYSSTRKSCLFCHQQGSGSFTSEHRVRFLRNSSVSIALPGGDATLGGIDSESELSNRAGLTTSFLRKKSPAIILSHNPLLFDAIDKNRDVLVLAGDTHGGQIPLPSWIWNLLGYRKNALYGQGFFQEGLKKMYVSRGTGTSHVPCRFLRPPELVVFHF